MKSLMFAALNLAVLSCTMSLAQQPISGQQVRTEPTPSNQQYSPGMTPEIWLYLQEMRRHDDPRQAVRRRAEFRSAQRQSRLASQKWFGLSNQRPQASPTPFTDTYSPYWSGNSADRFRWIGQGPPVTALHIERIETRRADSSLLLNR